MLAVVPPVNSWITRRCCEDLRRYAPRCRRIRPRCRARTCDHPGRVPNTIDSHRLMTFATAQGLQDALSEIMFRQ